MTSLAFMFVCVPECDAWDDKLEVKLADGNVVSAGSIDKKTPIYCPFHEDETPSAFVQIVPVTKKAFIHCSTCVKTFWKVERSLPEKCENYWSHSNKIYEFGIAGDRFFMSDIGHDKFYAFVDAVNKEKKDEAFRYLVSNKHIPSINLVRHLGDMTVEETTYQVDNAEGIVTVRYAATPVRVQDNAFIEQYLESTFGDHKGFIKEYLAVFCYTNHRDLPTLILQGERGSGKNTFAEMVYSIFPALSQMWEAKKSNFSPEAKRNC